MSAPEEKRRIAGVVADLRSRFQLPVDPAIAGPVPLERFLSEQSLQLVELPHLSRAGVYDYLISKGSLPGDLGGDEDLAGFLYLAGAFGRVFVNADDPVPRRRFTAAHELGHYLLHRDLMGGMRSIGDTKATIIEVEDDQASAMERQANRFAAELLMPAEICLARERAFRKTYQFCPRTYFAYHLAAELLVSAQAMRYRLQELGVADD